VSQATTHLECFHLLQLYITRLTKLNSSSSRCLLYGRSLATAAVFLLLLLLWLLLLLLLLLLWLLLLPLPVGVCFWAQQVNVLVRLASSINLDKRVLLVGACRQ
jgi:hypothetical protein